MLSVTVMTKQHNYLKCVYMLNCVVYSRYINIYRFQTGFTIKIIGYFFQLCKKSDTYTVRIQAILSTDNLMIIRLNSNFPCVIDFGN